MIFGSGSVGGGVIGAGIVFSLQDQFSATADKIKSKWKDLDATTEKATMSMQSSLNKMKLGFMGLAISGALLAPLLAGVSTTIKLEDQLADVRKTTGMTADEAERFKDNLFAIDTRSNINDLIDIAKIGGSLGVATDQLEGFTKAIDMANVALGDEFSGGAEEVTRALGTIKDLFKETKEMRYDEAMTKIGSALNELGAQGKATGDNVANFTNRIGQLGAIAPSLNETLALGATLQEVGINGEIAAGGLSALLTEATELSKQHDRMAQFAAQMNMTKEAAETLFNKSRGDFVIAFAKSFQGLAAADIGRTLKQLGIGGTEAQKVIGSLAGSTELYADRLGTVNQQLQVGDSLQKEFNVKNNTTGALLDKAQKKVVELADSLGQGLVPVIGPVVTLFMALVDILITFVKTPVGKFVISLTMAMAGLVAVLSIYVIVSNFARTASARLAIAFAAMGQSAIAATFANQGLIAGIRALTASMLANPYLLATVVVLVALAGAYTLVKKSVKEFKEVMEGTKVAESGFVGSLQRIGGTLVALMDVWRSANDEGFALSKKTAEALKKLNIYDFVINLATWLIRIKAYTEGFREAVSASFAFVGKVVSQAWEKISKVFELFGININKNLSDIKKWRELGKVVGYITAGILILTGALIAFTFVLATIVAAPIIAIIALIIYWGDITDWLGEKFSQLGARIVNVFSELVSWFYGLVDIFVSVGSSLVNGIWQGILNSWDWLKEKFIQLIRDLPGGSILVDFFTNDETPTPESGGVVTPMPIQSSPENSELMGSVGTMNAQRASTGRNTSTIKETQVIEKTRSVQVNLDGYTVGTWFDERNETKDNRE